MSKKYLILFIVLFASVDQSISQKATKSPKLSYARMCNARFGFCVDYPLAILYPQPLSENGDGRIFYNKNGDHILTTFGRSNNYGDEIISLESQYQEDLRNEELIGGITGVGGKVITYSKLASNYFVISGFYKSHIFYEKVVKIEDGFAYAILVYDESESHIYNQVAKRIFKTFK